MKTCEQKQPVSNFALIDRPGFAHRRIKVLVADLDAEFRDTLRLLINASPFLSCVGVAGSTGETIALARELEPDVILVDSAVGGAALDCTRILTALVPNTPIVIMTGGYPSDSITGALMTGAKGYLFKPFSRTECHQAILHAFSGGLRSLTEHV